MEIKRKNKEYEICEHLKKILDAIPVMGETIDVFYERLYFRRVNYFTTCICGKKKKLNCLSSFAVFICKSCMTLYRFRWFNKDEKAEKEGKIGTLERIKHLPFNDCLWKEEYKVEIISI